MDSTRINSATAAQLLSCSERTVLNLVRTGVLNPSEPTRKRLRFDRSAVMALRAIFRPSVRAERERGTA